MNIPQVSEQFGALMEANGKQMGQGSVFSLTLAKVKSIDDKDKLNRVRCQPITAKDNELTDWCYVMTPMSGPDRGLFMFPQVDDLVVLGYLGNDPHNPIVLGGFWCADSKPPVAISDGKAEDYCLKTPNKVALELHDEDKKQKMTITMPSGTVIEIDDDKQTVTTKNKGGDTSMLMKMKDGEIELKAKSKLTLAVGNASVVLESNGNITIKGTGGSVSIEGNEFSGKAQSSLAMQGANASVKGNASLSLESSGTAILKGSLLKLN